MSDALVPLDPHSKEAKDAVLALLGSTLAELKQIDRNVIGSSKDIVANRTNLQNVFNITEPVASTPTPAQVPQLSIPVTLSIPTTAPALPASVPVVNEEDPNQLVFDFTKKITPDTVNDKLDRILDKLDRILDKIK